MKPPAEFVARASLFTLSVAFTLIGLELGCRVWEGPYWLVHWPNRVWEHVRGQTDWPVCSHRYDARLGWAPNPGFTSPRYNVSADGYRVTLADDARLDGSPLLALGDSFTEGDEVADQETWPSYLQQSVGRTVVNAGVSGFGLDQIVLQAQRAVPTVHPGLIVVSFIANDLRRNELSRVWTLPKPYFELTNGVLELHPPATPSAACDSMPFWRRVLGWSMLVEAVLDRTRLFAHWYYQDIEVLPRGAGEGLACPLIQELAGLGIPTLVVSQFGRSHWRESENYRSEQRRLSLLVLACAAKAHLATLDLFDLVARGVEERGLDALYLGEHHSPEGNRMIARAIAAELMRLRLLPNGG